MERWICAGNLHYEKFADGTVKCIEDEIPFEVPEGWEWARIASVSSIVTDGEHKTPHRCENYSGYYLLSARNIQNSFLLLDNVDYVDREEYSRISKRCNPKRNDVLISCSGSVGRVAVVEDDNHYVMVRSAAMIRFINLNPYFGMYALQSHFLQLQIQKSSKQTAQANLFQGAILNLLLPIPPFKAQREIAKKVSGLFKDIHEIENEKIIIDDLLKRTKAKILDMAIRGKLVPQNPDDEPASALLKRIRAKKKELVKQRKIKRDKKESIIFKGEDNSYYEKMSDDVRCIDEEIPFDLPATWTFARLKHIGEIVGGGTPKTNVSEYWDGGIPWLTPADLSEYEDMYVSTGARTITKLGLKSSSAQMLPANAVLYSSRAPIGYIAIAANPVCTNQGFRSVVPYDFAMSPYLYYCLKARTDNIVQRATGTTFKEISGSEMAKTIIPLPPLNEQTRIFKKATQLLEVISAIEKSLS